MAFRYSYLMILCQLIGIFDNIAVKKNSHIEYKENYYVGQRHDNPM